MHRVNQSPVRAMLKVTMGEWAGSAILIVMFLAGLAYVVFGRTLEASAAIKPKTSISAVAVVSADEHRDAAIPLVVVTASRAQVLAAQAEAPVDLAPYGGAHDFDFIWVADMNNLVFLGKLLALVFLGYGAWLCFLHAVRHGNPLDWKSADFTIPMFPARGETQFGKLTAPLSLSPQDLRLVEGLGRHGFDKHALSGNGVIDRQHQRLSDYVDTLRATILSGRPVNEVNTIIDAFIRDVVKHFQEEEEILAAANYPGTAKHATLHRELVNSADTLLGQFRAGALGIGELFRFLTQDVLVKHMLGADREFILGLEGSR